MFPTSWGLDGTTSVNLPQPVNLVIYILCWAIIVAGIYFIYQRSKAAGFGRWTTQDILIVAIMAVLLEVYDNLIGDQFITPIIQLIPFGHAFALNDLPYMFLFVTGIALIRKPGAATAMVFLNFILMQLLYSGSGINPLMWPYGLFQGLFVDLYIVLRGRQIFANGGWRAVLDGFIIGALRAVPADTFQSAILGPLLEGQVRTIGYILLYSLFNLLGNGVEAAISAPLGIRIARSVNQTTGQDVIVTDGEEVSADDDIVPAEDLSEGRA